MRRLPSTSVYVVTVKEMRPTVASSATVPYPDTSTKRPDSTRKGSSWKMCESEISAKDVIGMGGRGFLERGVSFFLQDKSIHLYAIAVVGDEKARVFVLVFLHPDHELLADVTEFLEAQ